MMTASQGISTVGVFAYLRKMSCSMYKYITDAYVDHPMRLQHVCSNSAEVPYREA